jgi:ABC-type nickel/cobalt efflux system permease component RcnA
MNPSPEQVQKVSIVLLDHIKTAVETADTYLLIIAAILVAWFAAWLWYRPR